MTTENVQILDIFFEMSFNTLAFKVHVFASEHEFQVENEYYKETLKLKFCSP